MKDVEEMGTLEIIIGGLYGFALFIKTVAEYEKAEKKVKQLEAGE